MRKEYSGRIVIDSEVMLGKSDFQRSKRLRSFVPDTVFEPW
jgi:hypothetical protein